MASGNYSFVGGGFHNIASGNFSTVSGNGTTAAGIASTAMGQGGNAFGDYSLAIGKDISANGIGSAGLGYGNTTMGNYEFVAGIGNYAFAEGESVLGKYATIHVAANDETDRLFAIGNGASLSAASDALTILKNANTTIGGTLTINGNGSGTSSTFPAGRGSSGQFLKTGGDGTTSWSVVAKSDVGLGSVENTALSTWAGTSNITTLGTIATGTWHGTAIDESYIGNLSASKITSGTLDNARINWAAPSSIGSGTAASGAFTSLSATSGLSVSNGTVNIKPSGSSGTNGQVLTTDGAGNATWQNASGGVSTVQVRFIICVSGDYPSNGGGALTEPFIGQIIMFAGPADNIPENYLLCNGQSLSITSYMALYSIIGTTYGGNGTTNFNLPDLNGKVPIGKN
jgi:hypothetical protein